MRLVLSRRPSLPRPASRECGAVTPFVMMLCFALVALLGLVGDGGRALAARETALLEAEQAARSGAAQLSPASLHAGATALEGARAVAAADAYMAAAGHPGSASVAGSTVVATVRAFPLPTPLLALVGVDEIRVTASAAATTVAG